MFLYILGGWVVSYFVYDLFMTYENVDGELTTNAQSISKLYKNIKSLKQSKNDYNTPLLKIKLYTSTVLETAKTVFKFKKQRYMNKLFHPKELGNGVICVPYYYGNVWYNALILHTRNGNIKVLSVNNGVKDVFEEIKSYLGPSNNFYGQSISPNMLGYYELNFCIMNKDNNIHLKKFIGDEVILLN